MSIKDKISPKSDANLHVSFDVGHSSIGWAVLEKTGEQASDIKIDGCGSVVFRADDCLASSRRAYRRTPRCSSPVHRLIQPAFVVETFASPLLIPLLL